MREKGNMGTNEKWKKNKAKRRKKEEELNQGEREEKSEKRKTGISKGEKRE